MRKSLLFLACLLMTIGVALAQQRVVKGVVISKNDKQPVIGATVLLQGNKTVGTITDYDGRFQLKVPQSAKNLVVSYVGYAKRVVAIKGGELKVFLEQDQKMLDAVMVVAYGTAKKSSFTGSAVVLDKKQLEKSPASDISKALEGMVPGLQIASFSGAPGSNTDIRLRGVGSMSASSSPLIIVDGAPYEGSINSINPRDIESMNVLKDAASAALYGARGANGVIIITTKSGKEGRLQVSFDARLGVNSRGVPEYDVITCPQEYYEVYWDAMKNACLNQWGLNPNQVNEAATGALITDEGFGLGYNIYDVANDQVVLSNGKLNPKAQIRYKDADSFNDWASELYKPQIRQEYNLTITRGTEKSKVFFSLGYLNDKGYNLHSGFDRLSSRLSFESKLTNWLKVTASSQISQTTTDFNAGGHSFANTFGWTRNIAPIYPVYKHNAKGERIPNPLDLGKMLYDDGFPVQGANGGRGYAPGLNLIGQQELNMNNDKQLLFSENLRLDIDLPFDLKFNTTATYYARYFNNKYYTNSLIGDGKPYGGLLNQERNLTQTLNWSQVLNWSKSIGDVSLTALLGHEIYMENLDVLIAGKKGFLIPSPSLINAAKISGANSFERDYRIEGFFTQLTADYKDKYYLSASLRRDGSSVFAPENRWGTFWSVGASWRLSQEAFLKDVKALDKLKLRVSYGAQGNDNLFLPGTNVRAYTPYLDLYNVDSNGKSSILTPKYKGNKEITWEKNLNLDFGLEFSLWQGKLAGEFDVFKRTTKDMLFNRPIPSTTGFSTSPENLGSMENNGFEFTLSSNVYRSKNVSVKLGVNGSMYKNKIIELPDYLKAEGLSDGGRIIKEGGSIYDYYMVKYAGVNKENGDAMYYLYDDAKKEFVATPSAKYSSETKHRQFIGSATPKLMGGFFTNINAYGFDFSAQFSYRIGGIVVDGIYGSLMSAGRKGYNWHRDILNRWTPENKDSDIPRVELANQTIISDSDRFVRDGSYLALRSVNFGYTLPKTLIGKLGLQSLRLYVVGDNVALWSKKKGFDPRSVLNGAQGESVYSPMRTWSMGMTVNF